MKHFKLVYTPFPAELEGNIRGLSGYTNGKLIVMIDSNQDEQTQQRSLRHELAHISLGHFEDSEKRDVNELEAEAIAVSERMTDAELEALLQWAI